MANCTTSTKFIKLTETHTKTHLNGQFFLGEVATFCSVTNRINII